MINHSSHYASLKSSGKYSKVRTILIFSYFKDCKCMKFHSMWIISIYIYQHLAIFSCCVYHFFFLLLLLFIYCPIFRGKYDSVRQSVYGCALTSNNKKNCQCFNNNKMVISIGHQHKFPYIRIVFTMRWFNSIGRPVFVIRSGRPETCSIRKFSSFINASRFIGVSVLF